MKTLPRIVHTAMIINILLAREKLTVRILALIIMLQCGLFALHAQLLDQTRSYSEQELILHFKNYGLRHSIEGIWLLNTELSLQTFQDGSEFRLPGLDNIYKSKIKCAFILINQSICIFTYDETNKKYSGTGHLNSSIKPTMDRDIYYYNQQGFSSELGRFKEFNGIVVVRDNTIEYEVEIELADEIKNGIRCITKISHYGVKIAPSEADLTSYMSYYGLNSIPLLRIAGMYYMNIVIAGNDYQYMIDSGASYLTITTDMESEFKGMGILRQSDYRDEILVELADGTARKVQKVVLPVLKIGDHELRNIEVIISDGEKLIGQSVIGKFKTWSIDNDTNILTIRGY